MDLWQLKIFCTVVEEKSFSRAGEIIHLSQPTISSHVKALEDHFDCRLIDRLSRGALPTKAGELLYAYARKLVALRNETESAMADFQGKMKGSLAVGGSTIPGGCILAREIGGFVHTYPHVHISLTIGDTDEITAAILSGILELGVVGARAQNRQLSQEVLIDDEMQLIVPAGHPWADKPWITLEMLPQVPFISRGPGSGTLKSIERSLKKKGGRLEDLKISLEMGSTSSVIQAIKGGAGVSILSTVAAADDIQTGTLRALPVKGIDLKRSFYLTRLEHRSMSPIGQAFIRFLKDTFQNWTRR